MKASFWGGAALAILILLGAGAYAAEPVPPDKAADAEVSHPEPQVAGEPYGEE